MTKKEKNGGKKEVTIDAQNMSLGRVASNAAISLIGKTSPSYERHIYSGFPVKIINASKINISNKKLTNSKHIRYSGFPGGQKVLSGDYIVKNKGFRELLRLSIYQMLPDNKLRKKMMMNLSIEE